MKKILVLAIVLLLLVVSALPALAAPPALVAENTAPSSAAEIQGQTLTVPAHSSLWYRFDYPGDRARVTISMPNRDNNSIGFKVFTPLQMNNWWETTPIGQGTYAQVQCSQGFVGGGLGQCNASGLSWAGTFGESGRYYVQVNNSSNSPLEFALNSQTLAKVN